MFSGIVALADQVAGHRLGDINPALYLLGAESRLPHSPFHTGLVDVTAGDNSFGGVTGFPPVPGYDLSHRLGHARRGERSFPRSRASADPRVQQ